MKLSRYPDILEHEASDGYSLPVVYHIGRDEEVIDQQELIRSRTVREDILKSEDERIHESLRKSNTAKTVFRTKKLRPKYTNYKQEPSTRPQLNPVKITLTGAPEKFNIDKAVKFRSRTKKSVQSVKRSTDDNLEIPIAKRTEDGREKKSVVEDMQSVKGNTDQDIIINNNEKGILDNRLIQDNSTQHSSSQLSDNTEINIAPLVQNTKVSNGKHSFGKAPQTFFEVHGRNIIRDSRAEFKRKVDEWNKVQGKKVEQNVQVQIDQKNAIHTKKESNNSQRTRQKNVVEEQFDIDINQKKKTQNSKKKAVSKHNPKNVQEDVQIHNNWEKERVKSTRRKSSKNKSSSRRKMIENDRHEINIDEKRRLERKRDKKTHSENPRIVQQEVIIEPERRKPKSHKKKSKSSRNMRERFVESDHEIAVKERKTESRSKRNVEIEQKSTVIEAEIEVQPEKPSFVFGVEKAKNNQKSTGLDTNIEVRKSEHVEKDGNIVPVSSNTGSSESKDISGPEMELAIENQNEKKHKDKIEPQKFTLEKIQEKNLDLEKPTLVFK